MESSEEQYWVASGGAYDIFGAINLAFDVLSRNNISRRRKNIKLSLNIIKQLFTMTQIFLAYLFSSPYKSKTIKRRDISIFSRKRN